MNEKMKSKNLTELIKHMREESGFTQSELAKELGIAQTTLSGYETGYSEPNFALIEQIAKACDFEIVFIDKSTEEKFRVTRKTLR